VPHLVLLGDSIFDNGSYVPQGRAVIDPILDLRVIFDTHSDYSEISPIEPSAAGGAKLVRAIGTMLLEHAFATRRSVIYT